MLRQVIFGSVFAVASAFAASAQATPYYLHSTASDPSGLQSDVTAMNAVFGSGGWQGARYETVDAGAVFGDANFVFMEGNGPDGDALEAFLAANETAIHDYVFNGGTLFLNAAPTAGDGIDFGLGVTLAYDGTTCESNCNAVAPDDQIFNGPFTPIGTSFSGSPFSSGFLTGALTPLIKDSIGNILLGRLGIGNGLVIFGALNFTDDTQNLEDNIVASTQVPEPATLALFGVGLAAMGATRRRHKKA